jgi:hypothetical protein
MTALLLHTSHSQPEPCAGEMSNCVQIPIVGLDKHQDGRSCADHDACGRYCCTGDRVLVKRGTVKLRGKCVRVSMELHTCNESFVPWGVCARSFHRRGSRVSHYSVTHPRLPSQAERSHVCACTSSTALVKRAVISDTSLLTSLMVRLTTT